MKHRPYLSDSPEDNLSLEPIERSQWLRDPQLQEGPIEQSWLWGNFQGATTGRHHLGFYVIRLDGLIIGHIDLVEVKQRFYSYVWAKNGPYFYGNAPCSLDLIKKLGTLSRKLSPSSQFLRCYGDFHPLIGWTAFGFHITRTVIVRPQSDIDSFIASMPSQPGRNEARRSLKDPEIRILITAGDRGDNLNKPLEDFYALWSETARQKGFGIHYFPYIKAMLTELGPACVLINAYSGKHLMAGAIFTFWGPTATYYYAASRPGKTTTYAGMRCVMEAIMEADRRGCRRFDLLGIETRPGDRLSGVTRFKTKFSADIEQLPAVRDIPLRPWRYRSLRILYKVVRRN